MSTKSIDIWKNSRLLGFATGRMALGDVIFCHSNTGFLGFSTLAKTMAVIRHPTMKAISILAGNPQRGIFLRLTYERGF